jgi:hypothetical protein
MRDPIQAQNDCQLRLAKRGLTKLVDLDLNHRQLRIIHSSGFFSNCSVTLNALTAVGLDATKVKVIWPFQNEWRSPVNDGIDLFSQYFSPQTLTTQSDVRQAPELDHHGIYADIPYKNVSPYVSTFFALNPNIRSRVESFVKKYQIDYSRTIGLCFRGTDKWIETGSVAPGWFFSKARRLLAEDRSLRLLIQTDVAFIRKTYSAEFGNRAFFIEEMPVTDSGICVQQLPISERRISNFDLGANLLAVAQILSQCRYLISHTGNVGFWLYLLRGNAVGTCQLLPGPPDIITNFGRRPPFAAYARRLLKRLRRLGYR